MGDLVSVVVPIYNVEKYLRKCIETIISQTYSNIEIILVNDGSKDNCLQICNDFKEKDKRIKVINKENGGLSDARNNGLKNAHGKYICFIDSDDYISEKYIEELYNLIIENNAQIAVCSFEKVDESEKGILKKEIPTQIISGKEALEKFNDNDFNPASVVAWNKLYDINLFKNIIYPVGKIHEDEFTTYKLLYIAKKVAITSSVLYYYRVVPTSIMNRRFNVKRLDRLEALEQRVDFFRENKEERLYRLALIEYQYCLIVNYLNCKMYLENSKNIQNEILKKYRKNYSKIMKFKELSFIDRFKFTIVYIQPIVYYNIKKLKKIILGDDLEEIKERKLYICDTYYHLLIAIIKQYKSNISSDILLASNYTNDFLVNDKSLINRIKESKLFNNIVIFDYAKEQMVKKYRFDTLNQIFLRNKIIRKKEYNFYKYDNIYIFNDRTLIGDILNAQKIRYNILEDGLDSFKDKYKNYFGFEKNNWRKCIKKYLRLYEGVMESPYIKTIEVNDKSNLFIQHPNIIEYPKKKLFLDLNAKEKDEILKIFLEKTGDLSSYAESILILTQPLSEDYICDTEEEKINIYKEIINKYGENENIVIKIHPRETTNYFKYFEEYKNVKIITDKFPVEILNFIDIKFKKVITIFSTSINLIDNCNEKIELGYEYINKKLEKK